LLTGKRQPGLTDDSDEAAARDGVVVSEEDFYSALSHLVPSLSAAEIKRYDSLQDTFSRRRYGNQQQPETS